MKARRLRVCTLLSAFSMSCARSDPLSTAQHDVTMLAPERSYLPVEGYLPAFDATAWINTPPLDAGSLGGKVVLVQFWTYTCINWRRTLPYVRAWSQKYARFGLVVIGVHSPEFEFEKDVARVRQATRDANVSFPVAVDSRHAIWSAFGNAYWPALYFVDARGHIRHQQFGEGEYAQSETVIQDLLIESGASGVPRDTVPGEGTGPELPPDWADLGSQETYLGSERSDDLRGSVSPSAAQRGNYSPPDSLELNHWALTGDFTHTEQAVVLNRAPGRISYHFHARDLHLVMGPATGRNAVRFRVLLDGEPPGAAHGVDIDAQGNGVAREQRMYQLIRQSPPVVDRELQIEFLDSPIEAFSFTFG